jgi:Domain of unknown function (DUF397)
MDEVAACGGLSWRKSTWSGTGNCVEVAWSGTNRLVRDSKDPTGPVLVFTKPEWHAFLAGAKAGQFDDIVL